MKLAKKLEIALKNAENFEVLINIDEYQFFSIAAVFTAGGMSLRGAWARETYPEDYSHKEIRRWANGRKNAYIKAVSKKLVAAEGGKYARELLQKFETGKF